MKVLVTGANGLLAANVIRELNRRNIPVKGMVRKTSNLLSLAGAEYEKALGDVTNIEDVFAAADGCNVIIHAAANTSQNPRVQNSDDDLEGVKNIIRVVKDQKMDRLIFVSSANTFGYGTKKKPGNENSPMGSVFQKSLYASRKLKAQQLVLDAVADKGIDAVVVNPTFITGAHDAKPSSGRLLMMYFNKVVVVPKGGKNFVFAGDAAEAICNAISMGNAGECYLLAGENLTYKEFYEKVKKVSGIKRSVFTIPAWFLNTIGHAGSLMNKLGFSGEMTRENASILNIKNYYTSKKAQQELRMPQSSTEVAISESFNWFLTNNYLKGPRFKTATHQK